MKVSARTRISEKKHAVKRAIILFTHTLIWASTGQPYFVCFVACGLVLLGHVVFRFTRVSHLLVNYKHGSHPPNANTKTVVSKSQTINSFENWRQNLLYTLSLDNNFAPFLTEGITWGKKTKVDPFRDLTNDGEASRPTTQQKVNFLELLLGQAANYCPIISKNTFHLVKNSSSIQQFGIPSDLQAAFRISDNRWPFYRFRWHPLRSQLKTRRSAPEIDGVCRGCFTQG